MSSLEKHHTSQGPGADIGDISNMVNAYERHADRCVQQKHARDGVISITTAEPREAARKERRVAHLK